MTALIAAITLGMSLVFTGGHPSSAHAALALRSAPQIAQVRLNQNGGFTFQAGGQTFVVITRTSVPGGSGFQSTAAQAISTGSGTASWQTAQVQVRRTIEVTNTHIEVHDSVSNKTGSLVGVILENNLKAGNPADRVWIAGTEVQGDKQRYNPGNPSVFATYSDTGIGIVASDDVLRAQSKLGYFTNTGLRILDDALGISPNGSVDLVWSIYPTPSMDYWDFVNTVRRDWNANFTLDGPFSYDPGFTNESISGGERPADYYAKWASDRGLKYVLTRTMSTFANGEAAHGTAIPLGANFAATKSWMGKLRTANSAIKPLMYTHPQISSEPGAEDKYGDSAIFKKDGSPIVYTNKQHLPLFVPTTDNSYGRALRSTYQQLINAPELGGIYVDEMSVSYPELVLGGFAYGPTWDGYSVEISPTTHEVVQKKAYAALAMQSFDLELLNAVHSANKAIVANTEPYTKTMQDQHFPRFVEGQTAGATAGTNLAVPLVLANMHPERTPADAIQNAVAIFNEGGIYYGWVERWQPKSPDFNRLIFPITPVDLRPGVITARERIITTKSGTFGWADGSRATVYIFDDQADRRTDIAAHYSGGKYHINLPAGFLAILVKQ